jgi:hypothetical protein
VNARTGHPARPPQPVLTLPPAAPTGPGFETALTGTVVMSSVYTRHNPRTTAPEFTHLHIMAKQDNGMLFEAVQVVGSGPDSITRAAVMRGRCKPGVRIEAHGAFVGLAGVAAGDPPRLFLHGVAYIRTDPRPASENNVVSILNRMAERVPALARGMQSAIYGAQ